jgi:hypothetical protein
MNRIDFSKPSGFPLTAATLDFMQSDYIAALNGIASAWASAQNTQYLILSGCETSGNAVSSGICSVAGELLYCPGGSGYYVRIVETSQNATFADGQAVPVYITRMLVFGAGTGQIPWGMFARVPRMAKHSEIETLNTSLSNSIDSINNTLAGRIDGLTSADLSNQQADFGQSARNGSALTFARSDHYHALPAPELTFTHISCINGWSGSITVADCVLGYNCRIMNYIYDGSNSSYNSQMISTNSVSAGTIPVTIYGASGDAFQYRLDSNGFIYRRVTGSQSEPASHSGLMFAKINYTIIYR